MANWFARPAVKAGGGWVAGNQTIVAGPTAKIAGTIPAATAAIGAIKNTQTTKTSSANINDSTGNPIPDGTIIIVMRDDGDAWVEVAHVTTSGGTGFVSYTFTQFDPHPPYIFILPQQTGQAVETVCTPPVQAL